MKNKLFKGIIIDSSINNKSLLKELKEKAYNSYSHKLAGKTETTIFKLMVKENQLNALATKISKNMKPEKYYAHFVCDDCMVVIFPNKIFRFCSDEKDKMKECVTYGNKIGIDSRLMKFDELFIKDHPNDKNALVFGGSGDLGKAFCDFFLKENYNVYSTYFNNKKDYKSITQLKFSSEKNNNSFYKKVNDIDWNAIVFCIGTNSSKKIVVETDYDEYLRLLTINAISFLQIYKNLYKNLRKNHTKILVVSSSASIDNKKTNSAYSASKAYLDSIVQTIAKEESEFGVDVKLIHPSLFDSKLARKIVKMKGYNNFDTYVSEVLNNNIYLPKDIVGENIDFFKE